MSDKITVNIRCSQMMHFNQEVIMDREDYEALLEMDGNDVSQRRNQREFSIIECYINYNDIFDSDPEFDIFEIEEVSDETDADDEDDSDME